MKQYQENGIWALAMLTTTVICGGLACCGPSIYRATNALAVLIGLFVTGIYVGAAVEAWARDE